MLLRNTAKVGWLKSIVAPQRVPIKPSALLMCSPSKAGRTLPVQIGPNGGGYCHPALCVASDLNGGKPWCKFQLQSEVVKINSNFSLFRYAVGTQTDPKLLRFFVYDFNCFAQRMLYYTRVVNSVRRKTNSLVTELVVGTRYFSFNPGTGWQQHGSGIKVSNLMIRWIEIVTFIAELLTMVVLGTNLLCHSLV